MPEDIPTSDSDVIIDLDKRRELAKPVEISSAMTQESLGNAKICIIGERKKPQETMSMELLKQFFDRISESFSLYLNNCQ